MNEMQNRLETMDKTLLKNVKETDMDLENVRQ